MKYYFIIITLVGFIKCEKVSLMVRGEVANIKEFAHSAFLSIRCTETQGYMCGSSIVNQRILLTAAHCVDTCNAKPKMAVHVGHSRIDEGFVHKVHSALRHEQFHEHHLDNDIGLIRLRNDLQFSLNVRRVALLKQPPYFEKAKIAGWGWTEKDSHKSDILLYVDQYVWKQMQCKRSYPPLPNGCFCATSKKYNSYPSFGDSGGALTVRGYIQIGVASFKAVSSAGTFTIYTDIGYHYDWIRRNSKKLYCLQS